jgi:hypothetical protein
MRLRYLSGAQYRDFVWSEPSLLNPYETIQFEWSGPNCTVGCRLPNGEVPLLGIVAAGFPSPAEEELLDTMSLDEYLIENRCKLANYLAEIRLLATFRKTVTAAIPQPV